MYANRNNGCRSCHKKNCNCRNESRGNIFGESNHQKPCGCKTGSPEESCEYCREELFQDVEINQENQKQKVGNQNEIQKQEQTQGDLDQTQSQGSENQEQTQTQGDLEQTQSQGDEILEQTQTQGDLDQTQSQGDEIQEQTQTQGDLDQTQSLGDQTQNQTQGDLEQSQTLGDQDQRQRHGDQILGPQTLTNTPTINTPVTVSGVTVNVPVTVTVDCGCEKKKDKKNRFRRKKEECDCCAKALADLLNQIRTFEGTNPGETVDIYLLNIPSLDNPITGQTITDVNDCSTVSFGTGTTTTTLQLCNVVGISATTPALVQFLTTFARNCNNDSPDNDCDGCKGDHDRNDKCSCNNCANGIGEQLEFASRFGLPVDLIIEGLPSTIDGVFVLAVCDCLAFFVNNLVNPTEIYAFSLCSLAGFTISSPT